MTYAAELDDVRAQLRRGYAGNIHTLWPKVAGANRLVTGASASWARPDGTAIGALAVTNAHVNGVSRLRVTLDATGRDLGEDYRVDWLFTFDGIEHSRTTRVDVVTQPFTAADELSLNDMQDVWPDVRKQLLRQARAQQEDRSAEDQAGIYFTRAWVLVSAWIRKRIETDYPGRSMPSLIVSREDIRPTMVAKAIALAWRGDNNGPQAKAWDEIASAHFRELPALRFDSDQDRVPDATLTGWGAMEMRRGW